MRRSVVVRDGRVSVSFDTVKVTPVPLTSNTPDVSVFGSPDAMFLKSNTVSDAVFDPPLIETLRLIPIELSSALCVPVVTEIADAGPGLSLSPV